MKTITRRFVQERAPRVRPYRPRAVLSTRRVPSQRLRRLKLREVRAALKSRSDDVSSDSLVRDALKRIDQYCQKLPQDSAMAVDCWDAYNYFAAEAVTAEQECTIESAESGGSGPSCTSFLRWESFVRQLESSGGAKQMVRTILALKKAKEMPEAAPTFDDKKSSIVPASDIFDEPHTRRFCERLFELKDKDHDGRINVEEFRSLMKLIGDELRGDNVSVMFDALDVHGSLDFDEFLSILQAESIRSHSQSAEILRSAQKHGHGGDRPKWLDNL